MCISETLNLGITSFLIAIHHTYGYDYRNYNLISLKRRILKMCDADQFRNFSAFKERILNDTDYFNDFVNQTTVNYTGFFREPALLNELRTSVFPTLSTYPFIRIWIAGCSTGEEAYSLAILLEEAKILDRSIIYATDINHEVIISSNKGVFATDKVLSAQSDYENSGGKFNLLHYFKKTNDCFQVLPHIKKKIVFANHNLVSDHSFNQFQLIMCRNVLIYFNRGLQANVFDLFDESLDSFGYIGIGEKESIQYPKFLENYYQISKAHLWKRFY